MADALITITVTGILGGYLITDDQGNHGCGSTPRMAAMRAGSMVQFALEEYEMAKDTDVPKKEKKEKTLL